MQLTDIEWCDYSSNPLKLKLNQSQKLVNFCVLCSEGCAHCYSASITRRFWPKEEGPFPGFSPKLLRMGVPVINDDEIKRMLTFRPKPPYKHGGDLPSVFIGDMTDIFGKWVSFELLDKLFAVFAMRQDVSWLILTKRPEQMNEYISVRGSEGAVLPREVWSWTGNTKGELWEPSLKSGIGMWPLRNVVLGCSVEHQDAADKRIPLLRALHDAGWTTFVSYEPALGPINWRQFGGGFCDQIIGGGESGPESRPSHPDWFRAARDYCQANGVAYFHKQWGEWIPRSHTGLRHEWHNERTPDGSPSWRVPIKGSPAWGTVEVGGRFWHQATPWNGHDDDGIGDREAVVYRVGKKSAGRLLDGRTWDELPAPVAAIAAAESEGKD